jgi:hypothetical protein
MRYLRCSSLVLLLLVAAQICQLYAMEAAHIDVADGDTALNNDVASDIHSLRMGGSPHQNPAAIKVGRIL